jgi:hypothetical protein
VWTFYCYDDGEKEDLWARWYKSCDRKTKAAHDAYLEALEVREAHEWTKPFARHLKKGLFEIYVKSDVQWRLFGYFGRNHKITIVLIGYHKDKIYKPPNAIEKARALKAAIESGKARERRCDRPGKT